MRQGVQRTGNIVQGIDVSATDKNDVILFVVEESVNNQVLYLTSREGKLRRIVIVKAGEGTVSPITNEARAAFDKEKQFWADRIGLANQPK